MLVHKKLLINLKEHKLMANIFENLKLLKQDMEVTGWIINPFNFHFKHKNYIVLAILYTEKEEKPKYALLKLEFLEVGNFEHSLKIPANSSGLMVRAETLRKYFGIEYADNLGDILTQFSKRFSSFIPDKITNNRTREQEQAMLIPLSKGDAENPNKIYCYKVRRNPPKKDGTLGQRKVFNDNKTRLLRPRLYNMLSKDKNLSFCYSLNVSDEKSDEDIVNNWAKNQNS